MLFLTVPNYLTTFPKVCGETTATHVTSINVSNINLEVFLVFPLLVPSLLDAVGHCIVHACYEEWMWNYCLYVWTYICIYQPADKKICFIGLTVVTPLQVSIVCTGAKLFEAK